MVATETGAVKEEENGLVQSEINPYVLVPLKPSGTML